MTNIHVLQNPTGRKIIAILSSIGLLLISVQIVWATTTPQVCDSPFSKYGCSKVTYNTEGSGILVTDRNFRGAIDGGAQQWQIYWVKDWEKVGGSYVFREKWGPGGWRTDVNLSSWFGWSSDDRTRITDTIVWFKFRYYECIPDGHGGQECYYWCSTQQEHRLLNNTSSEVGTGICAE